MKVHHIIFVLLVFIFVSHCLTDAADMDIEKDLQKGLEQSSSIIARAKEKLADGRPITHELDRLTTIAEDIKASHLLLQERFRLREDKVMDMGANAPDRHRVMVEGYIRAIEEFLTLMESLPPGEEALETILDDLKTLLDRILYKKKALIFGSLPYRSLNYPASEPAEAPSIKPAYKGGNKTVLPDDLKSAIEAPMSEEIATFAESLKWNPVLIYEWVKNNVETEWYWGCMKGAEETLKQKSGNDCDQAALLIALLRASGFPSRYVRGVIEFFPGIETVQNLTGIEDPQEIARFFQKAGIPYKPVVAGGKIANFQIEHIWVESQIPFANFHGAVVDEHGKAWLGLDTSIKVTGYTYNDPADILQELSLSEIRDEYLSTLQDQTPLEYIRTQIEAYLAENDPDTVYEDLLRTKTLVPEVMNLLPASLQYKQILITHEYAEIPDELIHKVKFTATTRNPQPATDNLFDITLETLAVSNQQIAISYEPETVEDHEIINLFGGLDNTPAYLVKLRPVLKVNAENVVVGTDGLTIGAEYDLNVELISPNGVEKITNTHIAGNYAVIGIVSGKSITPDAVPDEEKNAWRLLYEEAISYIDRWNQAEQELASLMHLTITRPISTVVTLGGVLDVTYLLDTPHGFEWKGVYVDADIRIIETVPSSGFRVAGERQKDFMRLSSLQGSILENRILEDAFQVESISTAKIFQLANDDQIPILTIDKNNLNSILPTLPFAEGIKEDIENAVNQGLEVRIPKSEIVYEDWTGIGYITEDPETGASGWMLSGMIAGGMTATGIDKWAEHICGKLRNPYSPPTNYDPGSARYISKITKTDMQKGTVGEALVLKAIVHDKEMHPVQGAEVTFTIKAGGGKFESDQYPLAIPVRTEAGGIASARLILGEKTEYNPTYWWEDGYTYPQQVGENIVEASLSPGGSVSGVSVIYTAYGFPKGPSNIRKLLGDGNKCPIFSYAGIIGVSIEDKYGNPLSNKDVDFWVAKVVEIHQCINPNLDISPALLLRQDDPCKIGFVTWRDCGDNDRSHVQVKTSNEGAYANVILGGIPDARYTITATYTNQDYLLTTTFNLETYPFGNCEGMDDPSDRLHIEYIYPVDSSGKNITAVEPGKEIELKARLYHLREGEEIISECDGACEKIVGSRQYSIDTKLTNPKVQFSFVQGIDLGEGIFEYPYTVRYGLNLIQIDGTATVSRKKSDNICSKPPHCRTKYEEITQNVRLYAEVYGVEAEVEAGPVILVNEDGTTINDYIITSEIRPHAYQADTAYVAILQNGVPVSYISRNTSGKDTVILAKGYWFDISTSNYEYEAQLVLNIGREVQIKSKPIPLDLSLVKVDIDIVKTNGNELPEDEDGIFPGGYVAVNNDDDDADGVLDSADTNGVLGESDMIPIIIHPVQPAELAVPQQPFWLVFGNRVKIWKKNNHTEEVISDETILKYPSKGNTTLYVEGISEGEETAILRTVINGVLVEDIVKFTVYKLDGPLNVPEYSTYRYGASIPGKWECSLGEGFVMQGLPEDFYNVIWKTAGPAIGHIKFKPNDNFSLDREVNIIQVKVEPPDTGKAFYYGDAGKNIVGFGLIRPNSIRVWSPSLTANTWSAKITAAGPMRGGGGNSGIKNIEVGFVQNVQIAVKESAFLSAGIKMISSMVGNSYLDTLDPNNVYYNTHTGAIFRPTPTELTKVIKTSDSPIQTLPAHRAVPLENQLMDLGRLNLEFELFVVARTTDTLLDSDIVNYFSIAKANWYFYMGGGLYEGANPITHIWEYYWKPSQTASINGDTSWTIVKKDGSTPAITGRPTANEAAKTENYSEEPLN